MFVLGNLLVALGQILNIVLDVFKWVVIIRALISWVSPDPYNPIVQFLQRITDPLLTPIQRKVPPMGGLDLSPIILLLAIIFLQLFFVKTMIQIGYSISG